MHNPGDYTMSSIFLWFWREKGLLLRDEVILLKELVAMTCEAVIWHE